MRPEADFLHGEAERRAEDLDEVGLDDILEGGAVPWQFDEPAKALVQRGLIPVMQRQVGYLPGIEAPFDVELVSSDQ